MSNPLAQTFAVVVGSTAVKCLPSGVLTIKNVNGIEVFADSDNSVAVFARNTDSSVVTQGVPIPAGRSWFFPPSFAVDAANLWFQSSTSAQGVRVIVY